MAQIRILGLKDVPEAEVRAMLKAREWAAYTPEDRSADLAALLGSGRFTAVAFKSVELSSAALRLDITLTEGRPRPPSAGDEPPPSPWVLGELEIRGQKNVKPSVIRAQIRARKGDLYERSELDRDIQNILSLGQFERVTADVAALPGAPVPEHLLGVAGSDRQVRLAFLVEEKPLVRKVRFSGNKAVSKGRLNDEISLRPKDPFDRSKLREDTDKLLDYYRKKGYHSAGVEPRVAVDTAAHQVEVVFEVLEGPKARIGEVRIDGVTAFKPRKVARQMKNRRKKVFSDKEWAEDPKRVETFYKNRGYADFAVEGATWTFSDDRTRIFIRLAVKEGPQYRFGESSFSGNTVWASTTLAKALEYRRGKLFSQEKLDLTVSNVRDYYAEKGRVRTVVTPARTYNAATRLMDFRFDIEESGILYVDHVDVEGNKATKTHVLKREIVVKEGQPFQLSKVRKSQDKIMNLGFIDDVQLGVTTPLDPDRADMTFEVVEGKPGMLTAGAGFSSLDGLVGTLSLQHLNLFGRAQRASVQWSFGSRVQDYSLSWTTPWLKNKPVSLGFDLFNTRRIAPFETSLSGYTSKRTGGTVRLGPRFQDDKYQLNFSYSIQFITLANIENRFLGRLSEGTSIYSSFGTSLARDTRDNFWDPARGTRHEAGLNLAGGPFQGDIHFFKPYVSNALHHTLFTVADWPFVLSVANRAAYVTQFSETREVPVFERYFIGGQDTLRGYSPSGEAGYRDGGKAYDIFNIEFGFPLARERRKTIVKFVTFFDAGGSWDTLRSVRWRIGTQEPDIKTDVGFGIRFTTPAFPIRLDWGYGLQHRHGEQRYQINFGIGNLF